MEDKKLTAAEVAKELGIDAADEVTEETLDEVTNGKGDDENE